MRRLIVGAVALVVLVWAALPLARGALLVRHGPVGVVARWSEPAEEVTFVASDGVRLRGTLLGAPEARATVILVHGFKSTRDEMAPYASFLRDAGYAVLLYDSRGCGASDGVFGVGATEDRDVRGAVSFVRSRGAARVAVLGVSLGAGAALLAAERDEHIDAVVADSAWTDEQFQLDHMRSVRVGRVEVPLLPYERVLVDALIGGRLEDARPVDHIDAISPRPLLLIHSADDTNATTTLAGARALYDAAGQPKELWIAPSGGHAGALGAQPDEYVRRVLAFLGRALS